MLLFAIIDCCRFAFLHVCPLFHHLWLQDYFKQSSSRLLFIVHQIFQITVEIYQDPPKMVDELSALGLRHVGYGIPTMFFSPFVTGIVESMKELPRCLWGVVGIMCLLVLCVNHTVWICDSSRFFPYISQLLFCTPKFRRCWYDTCWDL